MWALHPAGFGRALSWLAQPLRPTAGADGWIPTDSTRRSLGKAPRGGGFGAGTMGPPTPLTACQAMWASVWQERGPGRFCAPQGASHKPWQNARVPTHLGFPGLIPRALELRFFPPHVSCSCVSHAWETHNHRTAQVGWDLERSSGPAICGKGSLDEFIKPLWFWGEGRAAFSNHLWSTSSPCVCQF